MLPGTDTFELPIERLKTAFAGLFYSLAKFQLALHMLSILGTVYLLVLKIYILFLT